MSDYATVAEFKDEVQVDSSSTDDVIQDLLDAAEDLINSFCNRHEGFLAIVAATAKFYNGSGNPWLNIDENVEVTAVAVKDSPSDDEGSYTSWVVGIVGTTTDADVFPARGGPRNPEFNRTPYDLLIIGANSSYQRFTSGKFTTRRGFDPSGLRPHGVPTVKVSARWGYADSVAPPKIKQATIMQAARWYQRLKASMADTIAGPEFGKLMFRKVLDPDIALILKGGRLVRPAIGGGP